MDSEDSRDASSGSESNDDGPQSPDSVKSSPKSSPSRSRSSSPPSRAQSVSPQLKQPSAKSRSNSVTSSSSEDEESNVKHRPRTPKTPPSEEEDGRKVNTPASPPPQEPLQPESPQYSSRSNSPKRLLNRNDDNDNVSVKSLSSDSSKKSVSSRGSNKTGSTRRSRSRRKSEDDTSYSSDSSVDSSRRKNNKQPVADTLPEEISDGDMESDHGKQPDSPKDKRPPKTEAINITHEDLSDVSDLEESIGHSDNDNHSVASPKDDRDKDEPREGAKSPSPSDNKKVPENNATAAAANRPNDETEEQLDFEAEDGECGEIDVNKDKEDGGDDKSNGNVAVAEKTEEKKEEKEELEEGEVTDDDDVRPEETQPRPVCRFFSRGQCTWGESCRFLHPGVTDKGNYTMFEMIRPIVPGEFGRVGDERMFGKPEPPLVESAWERGLRTAKEMLRKSVKRKEQDIDFEEKKMNLSLAQEEFDKENGYYGRGPSPEPRFVRHIPAEYPPVARPPPEEYYPRRQVLYEHEYVPPPPRERGRPYRELPPHRMPDYYANKYEEEPPQTSNKRPRPKREVIVQRAEERQGRGDEWSDPWMRSKSPAGGTRRKERKRSYSSGSSYSSSSSSHSSSDSSRSSYRSRSRSSYRRARHARSGKSKHVSPSVIVSERKAANERAALMNPPAPKRRAPSPGMMRVSGAANPPAPPREDFGRNRNKLAMAAALARVKARKSSRSSSGSSASSSSDSDSSDSSSSSSHEGSSPTRRPPDISLVKAMDALKGSALEKKQIKLNLKSQVGTKKAEAAEFARKLEQAQGKKRPASSPPPGDKSKKATSRREELLKQLKAVEDAIAKKRSKVN